jgi:ankyrin repeat protein
MTLQELIHLIYKNSISELKAYRVQGVDFTVLDSYDKGNLLISYSVYGYQEHYTKTEMVKFLIESGIDVNHQSNGRDNQKSALHSAVSNEHFEIVKILIENRADIEVKDKNGNTPLWNAIMMYRGDQNQLEIIKYLMSKGSSLDTKNNHDSSPRDIINTIGEGIDNDHNQKEWDLRFLLNIN